MPEALGAALLGSAIPRHDGPMMGSAPPSDAPSAAKETAALVGGVGGQAAPPSVVPVPAAAQGGDEEAPTAAAGAASLLWTALPPLPEPRADVMRSQARGGTALVLGVIAACIAATHTAAAMEDGLEPPMPALFLVAVYAEAAVAIVCLLGLMRGDPGVIQRSAERCTPIPSDVASLLATGSPLPPHLRNVTDPQRGSFCVRCLIWRQAHERAHHCSTCQRCVCDFDHHCGVFGRCIAGDSFAGNMGYFKVIIGMGSVGALTAGSAVLISMSRALGWGAVGYGIAGEHSRLQTMLLAGSWSPDGAGRCRILRRVLRGGDGVHGGATVRAAAARGGAAAGAAGRRRQLILWLASGVSNEGPSSRVLVLVPPFLGPGFWPPPRASRWPLERNA